MEASHWHAIPQSERIHSLDVLRGLALFGVLLVNLLSSFRVPLAVHLLNHETPPAWADRVTETLVASTLEFKAFTLFSLLFGVGIGVFTERASVHRASGNRLLIRRLTGLLVLGLCHLLLIWNGDILTLYAVCGFLLLPLLRLPTFWLASTGGIVVVGSLVYAPGFLWPGDAVVQELGAAASRICSTGGFGEIFAFHFRETRQLILPLLAMCLPRTLGLMMLGVAAWRAGIFRAPENNLALLWLIVVAGAITPLLLKEEGAYVALALSYAAGLLLILQSPKIACLTRPFAAVGQLALTNYLMQSIVLSVLFYGYGLRLMGVGSAAAALIGIAFYAGQVVCSMLWLRKHRFGPVEWAWRCFTYGTTKSLGSS